MRSISRVFAILLLVMAMGTLVAAADSGGCEPGRSAFDTRPASAALERLVGPVPDLHHLVKY